MRNGSKKYRGLLLVGLLLISSPALSQKKEKPLGLNAIPAGTAIFIEPNGGFETYLMAAFAKEKVPLLIVIEKEKAELVLTSTLTVGKEPGIASAIFLGKSNATQDASIVIVDLKAGVVKHSYSVHKYSPKSSQSTAEAIAKNVKKKIESRQ